MKQNAFLPCSWRFIRSNTLAQFRIPIGTNNWGVETYMNNLKKIDCRVFFVFWKYYWHDTLILFELDINCKKKYCISQSNFWTSIIEEGMYTFFLLSCHSSAQKWKNKLKILLVAHFSLQRFVSECLNKDRKRISSNCNSFAINFF